jgi:hypothetical protein
VNDARTRLLVAALAGESPVRDERGFELLVRAAREADLLGRLAWRYASAGRLDEVPAAARAHLVAATNRGRAQHAAVRREATVIADALRGVQTPIVLLKGAAYLLAGLPPAHGRLFSDMDILVAKERLAEVEAALMLAGFATTHLHPYDQRYYRRWMHELPPMQHLKRQTLLDVHHTIVPETAGVALDARALFRAAVPLAGTPFHVLSPLDMVLHSATHLMHNEEFGHGLRDLVDIDALLRHFGADPTFWPRLAARAEDLDLGRPLYYALRTAARVLGTSVPSETRREIARYAPVAPVRALMDRVLERALAPAASSAGTRWARRALYVRGHWLKMPVPLLAWHLTFKALRRDVEPA